MEEHSTDVWQSSRLKEMGRGLPYAKSEEEKDRACANSARQKLFSNYLKVLICIPCQID